MSALRWFIALAWLVCVWLALGLPALGVALASRPNPPLRAPIGYDEPRHEGGRTVIGHSYREMVGAIAHLHLVGTPLEIGWAHGALAAEPLARLERDMIGEFLERVPTFAQRHLLLGLVHWNDRDLDQWFTAAEREEIAAVAIAHRAHDDPFAALGPGYVRSLSYHALHDISQYLIDNPLVHPPQIGCTALAVRGARARDGHLLVGRLFDFEGGRAFDVDKAVITCEPDGGIPFVSVVWNGMAGAVTGMNREGLWISINAAATDHPRFIGRPVVMVVREVLQTCRTIDEAVQVIRRAEVFVSNAILLASRRDDRAVCVENGPHGCAVRAMQDDRLVLTNHFLAPAWSDDRANQSRIANGTTTKRYARALALIDATPVHDPASLLAILRDRRGAGGEDVGFGNRGTINAWIGAHLVVADVTAGVLWVCEPFHGLGRAIPFDVAGPVGERWPTLPASDDLARCIADNDRYQLIQQVVVAALREGRRDEAKAGAATLLELDPQFFNANALAAECEDDPARRAALIDRALALQPAYPSDRAAIERLRTRK